MLYPLLLLIAAISTVISSPVDPITSSYRNAASNRLQSRVGFCTPRRVLLCCPGYLDSGQEDIPYRDNCVGITDPVQCKRKPGENGNGNKVYCCIGFTPYNPKINLGQGTDCYVVGRHSMPDTNQHDHFKRPQDAEQDSGKNGEPVPAGWGDGIETPEGLGPGFPGIPDLTPDGREY